MPRCYTNDFPAADQENLEQEFARILAKDNGWSTPQIAAAFLSHWNMSAPVYVGLFVQTIDTYLYDLGTLRTEVTAERLLLFLIQKAFPQFVVDQISS